MQHKAETSARSCHMKNASQRFTTRSCVTVVMTAMPSLAFAQGYCDSFSGTGLNLGCSEKLANSIPALLGDPSPTDNYITPVIGTFDGLIWDADWVNSAGERRLRFGDQTNFTSQSALYSPWKNIYIGSTRTDGGQTPVTMTAAPTTPGATPGAKTLEVTLQMDRLTLENTHLSVLPGTNLAGQGEVENFILGFGTNSPGGGLTLRNASLSFSDGSPLGGTDFRMAAPAGVFPFIRAESGVNTLSLGDQTNFATNLMTEIASGATLELKGTTLITNADANLVSSGVLRLEGGSELRLLQNDNSPLSRSTITGGAVDLDGATTSLYLTNPEFSDSQIAISGGAQMFVQKLNGDSSRLSFSGNNTVRLEGPQSGISGPAGSAALQLLVGPGTTRFENTERASTGRGLLVDDIRIDGGTLDWTAMQLNDEQLLSVRRIEVLSNGVFKDRQARYGGFANALDVVIVDNATLQSVSQFGSFLSDDGLDTARFTDATLDLFNATGETGGVSAGLRDLTINANSLSFSGDNRVLLGVSPYGECLSVGGSCVPGTERFSGTLLTNVGNSATASASGFGTLLFVPKAIDPSASASDYVNGGVNGVYTVAVANEDSLLTSNQQAYDAPPRTPTVSDLGAAGSDLPANLIYTIVNDPVADDQVDIAFVDIGLNNHPLITPSYTPQKTTSVVLNPNTGNTTTTTVTTTPTGNGATQTVTTTITAPGGGVISTNTVTNTLGPATGTKNTLNYAQLLTNSGNTLPHNGLQNVSTLHPEAYASFMTVALEQSDLRRNMVLSNANGRATGNGRIDVLVAEGRNVWFDVGVTEGDVDADGGLAGFDYDLNQFIVGADIWSDTRSRAGAYLGYGRYSMNEHTPSADTLDFSSDAFSLGAYAAMDTQMWSFSGMAGVSWGQTEATRDAIIGTNTNRHSADYDHRTFEIAIRAEYTALPTWSGWHAAPEVGLGYAYYEQDGFTESGDRSTALAIDDTTAESLIGSIGVNVSGPAFAGGLMPIGFLRYERDFLAASENTHDIDAAFAASPGISQSFVGTHRGENAISVGLGLGTVIGASVDASAGVVYQRNSNGDEIGGGARITWRF